MKEQVTFDLDAFMARLARQGAIAFDDVEILAAIIEDQARQIAVLRAQSDQDLIEAGKALADAAQAFLNKRGWRAAPDLADALTAYGYAEMRKLQPTTTTDRTPDSV